MASLLARIKRSSNSPSDRAAILKRIETLYRGTPRMQAVGHRSLASHCLSQNLVIQELLPEWFPVLQCLGPELCKSRWDGELKRNFCHEHEEISLYVALRAVESLNANDASWMEWSSGGRGIFDPSFQKVAGIATSPEDLFRLQWLRTLFRAALTLPIGYFVSHTSWRVTRSGMAWNPVEEDLPAFERIQDGKAEVFRSGAVIDARLVSYGVFLRIFPPSPIRVPGLSLAVCDFFSSRPDPSNPLYRAWHTAMHYFFYERHFTKLPFWWVTCINHHFVRSETYRPIPNTCELRPTDGETDWVPPQHRARGGDGQQSQVGTLAPGEDPADDSEPSSSATVIAPGPNPGLPPEHEPETPAVDSSSAPEEEIAQDPVPEPLSELTEIALGEIELQRSVGTIGVNCKGAIMQKHAGVLFLVYPLFFRVLSEKLNRPEATPEALEASFQGDGLLSLSDGELLEYAFEIRPPGAPRRLGKVRAVPLSERGATALWPEASALADNDALIPMGAPKALASAAG